MEVQTRISIKIDQIAVRRGRRDTRERIDFRARVAAPPKDLLIDQSINAKVPLVLQRRTDARRVGQWQPVEFETQVRELPEVPADRPSLIVPPRPSPFASRPYFNCNSVMTNGGSFIRKLIP